MNTGNYEIYINGLTCTAATKDDMLNLDGFADEVFFVVGTKVVDLRTGDKIISSEAASFVAGDIHGWPNRIAAGSGRDIFNSLRGGFVSGDSYPALPPGPNPTPWLQTMEPSGRNFPPYKIWGGTLQQGDPKVTFLIPALWEFDPSASAAVVWTQWLSNTDKTFGAKAKEVFGGIFPVAKPFFDAVSLGIQTFTTLVDDWGPFGKPGSRPIGLTRDSTNKTVQYNPLVLALTYDVAEALVSANPSGKGQGRFGHIYLDDPQLAGNYQVWFEIRKTGGGDVSGPRASMWRLDSAGARASFQEYGPFDGWTTVNCDSGKLLWRHTDGRASLWSVDKDCNRTGFVEHGPFPGYTPLYYADGQLLWRHADHHISIWKVDNDGQRISFKEHAPTPGWTPVNVGDTHILWRHDDGRASLWVLDDQGQKVSAQDYGPFAGFTAINYAEGRILWRHADGRISLWKVNPAGVRTGFVEHGPFSGWTAVNCANNNVLWAHADGRVSLWFVDAKGGKIKSVDHGPFPGWLPVNCADGNIVWQQKA